MQKYERKGEQAKCPVCGWRIDTSAYRCPKCRVYFCYKCRVQLRKGDAQFECADQTCACYGKLLCASCSPPLTTEHPTTRTETLAGWAFPIFIASGISTVLAFCGGFGLFALLAGVVVFAVLTGICIYSGARFFEDSRKVPDTYTTDARSCIQCKHPVKHVDGPSW